MKLVWFATIAMALTSVEAIQFQNLETESYEPMLAQVEVEQAAAGLQ